MIEYSFIVPVYNDGYLVEPFCVEFEKVFKDYLDLEDIREKVELIFINDGSENDSFKTLKEQSVKFAFIKAIDLSRNFGQHIAISCGYEHAKGKYIGMMNVDMQDPPSEIPKLLNCIKNNDCDIVLGRRKEDVRPYSERISSHAFNFLLNKLSGFGAPLNTATLRVMNRRFIDGYNRLEEKTRYLPGLELWLGFKHIHVDIEQQKRKSGKSSYTFKKRLMMAADAILSFSDFPLRVTAYMGIVVAFLGFLLGLILVVQKIFFIELQPGYTSTISLIVFIGGVQILVVGLSGLYVGRILNETRGRPLYLIREMIGASDD